MNRLTASLIKQCKYIAQMILIGNSTNRCIFMECVVISGIPSSFSLFFSINFYNLQIANDISIGQFIECSMLFIFNVQCSCNKAYVFGFSCRLDVTKLNASRHHADYYYRYQLDIEALEVSLTK